LAGIELTSNSSTWYVENRGALNSNNLWITNISPAQLVLSASGNLGLQVTPSAWGAGSYALQINSNLSLWSASATNNYIYANAYYDGTNDKYVSTAEASRIRFAGATTIFNYAASGSANANITWLESMRITSSGNLLVGTTSQIVNGNLSVLARASSNAAAFESATSTVYPILSLFGNEGSGNQIFTRFSTDSSVERGSITYNRGAGLVVYNTTSDYRAKDISGPVTNSGALIDSVPVYMGKMKWATEERPMFIAHETPSYAHTGEKDAVDANGNPVYQQMDASALIPVMWAEIQSLRKRLADAGI